MQDYTKDRKTDTNAVTIRHWMPIWVKNAVENRPYLKALAKKLKKDLVHGTGTYRSICISSIVKRPLVPCLVVGSGPSLDDYLPYVKDFPGVVIAGATNARTLAASGRIPDFICCLDSNKDTWAGMEAKGFDWGDAMLITHPSCDPTILKNWKGQLRMFRPMQMGYDFFDNVYPQMYDFIEFGLVNAGCTVNTELELATLLGCAPVIITGVDLGFVDGRARCAQFKYVEGRWERQPDPPLQTKSAMRRSRAGCLTTEEMAVYKQNFFLLARTEATTVYSCSRGIIRPEEVSGFIAPNEVNKALEMHKLELSDPKEIEAKYDKVLEEFGVKISEEENGIVRVARIDEKKEPVPEKPLEKKAMVFQKMAGIEGIKVVEKNLDKNQKE